MSNSAQNFFIALFVIFGLISSIESTLKDNFFVKEKFWYFINEAYYNKCMRDKTANPVACNKYAAKRTKDYIYGPQEFRDFARIYGNSLLQNNQK